MGREASLRLVSLQSEQELNLFPHSSSPSGSFVLFCFVNMLELIELILLKCVLLLH